MTTNTDEREEIKPVAPTEQTKWRDPSLVGKYMVDPKTGLAGIFRSPDNGETWVLTDTVYGHVYNQDEVDNIWDNGAAHKVADEIKSATADLPNIRKQADEAVKFAESAVAASKVNSDAIVAQSEAISEAKSAMDSATAEIQQTAANAASDAAKIRADVAQVQSEVDTAKAANSASVEALKSDVSAAKQDLADVHDSLTKAQSAIEQNQKAIDDNVAQISDDITQDRKDIADVRQGLTKAQADITANQKSINDNVAQINADITQDRKDIASAQQANEDTAKQLDDYSKQAAAQGKTIKSIQDKQDGFTATLADVQGNVAQVSDKVDGLSASLKDTQGNVASVKAQADQLSATLTDHGKAIATLAASAKELSSTLEDADGRLSKVEQTAQTNSSTLSDVQGDLSQVKQNATRLVSTLKDAQGNISTLQQKADSVSTQLASAQGDIATLQTGVDSVKATLTSHDKSIHTLQTDSKSLKDSMADAQGDISTLSKTATDVTSELEDHTGRLSKVEQSAAKQATTLSDLQGNLSQVEQKADSNTATISSINKNAMQDRGVITDAKTSFDSLTQLGTYSIKAISLPKMPEQHYGTLVVSGSAGSGWLSQQFVADTTGNIYTRVFSNNAWSAWKQGGSQDAINQVKQTADSNSATIRNVQGDVSTLKQTAAGVEAALADHEGDIHTLQVDSKTLKDDMADAKGNISSLQKTSTSLVSEFRDHDGRLSKVEQTATEHTSELADTKGNIDKVTQKANTLQLLLSDAQKNIQNIQLDAKGLHDTLNGQSNQLASLNVTLNNLDSKYSGITGDLQSKQTALSTEQQQTKDILLRKADKSEVDNVKGTVNQVSAEQKTMADQINQKVSSVEYQTLKDKVNGMKIGGRNLLIGTSEDELSGKAYAFADYQISGGLQPGKTYTLSGWARVDQNSLNHRQNVFVDVYSEDWSWSVSLNISSSLTSQHDKITFTTPTGKQLHPYVTVYLAHPDGGTNENNNDAISGMAFIKKLKLEEGDFDTDYTHAPEDTITAINKNATAIDENSKLISLMAKQTEVDNVKNTAQQISSRLDILAGEVKSKVDETRVNNIVDGKGFTTQSTVQSLIDQKAGTLNESIANLTSEMNTRNGVNLLKGTKDFSGSWRTYDNGKHWYTENWVDPNGNPSLKSEKMVWSGYYQPVWLDVGEYTFSCYYYPEGGSALNVFIIPYGGDNLADATNGGMELDSTANSWHLCVCHFTVTKAGNTALRLENRSSAIVHIASYKLEKGTVATPVWTPAPSDNATVTQVQSLTASIDGLQSRVTNYQNDTSSKYTQLSNLMQSKVGTADFEQLKRSVDMQTLDSADINNMKTNGHYFVHNLANNPIGGWVYVDVTGDGKYRIRQDVYQDSWNKHKFRNWYGDHWTGWEEGATYTEITQLQDAVNLRVQKGELLSQINLTAGNTLIQSNKLYLDASSVVFSGRAFIPSAAIVSLDADKITTGVLNGIDIHQIATKEGRSIDISGGNITLDSWDPYAPRLSFKYQGQMVKMFNATGDLEADTWGIFNFSPSDTQSLHPIQFFRINNVGGKGSGSARMQLDHAIFDGHEWWANFDGITFGRSYDGINGSNDYVDLYAKSFLPHSQLSSKTRIEKLNGEDAMNMIKQVQMYTYQFKDDVRDGKTKRYASLIIDDVHDVAQYTEPDIFVADNKKCRDDGTQLAYAIAAIQYQQHEIEELKLQLKEKKANE